MSERKEKPARPTQQERPEEIDLNENEEAAMEAAWDRLEKEKGSQDLPK